MPIAEDYNSTYTGTEIDSAVGRALPDGAIDQSITNRVRYDAAQSLTANQMAQARRNIGGEISRNLLDNWYFVDPINTLGNSTYTGAGQTINRWAIDQGSVLVDNGITLQSALDFWQNASKPTVDALIGKQITASALTDAGILYTGTTVVPTRGTGNGFCDIFITSGFALQMYINPSGVAFTDQILRIYTANEIKLIAVKLELGVNQTLAVKNASGAWVLTETPNKAVQQAICTQYAPDTGIELAGWVSPPLQLGVEYRTMQRYLGKPVYVRLVSCGSAPSNSLKKIDTGLDYTVIDRRLTPTGNMYASSNDNFSIPCESTNVTGENLNIVHGTYKDSGNVRHDAIFIYTTSTTLTGYTVYVVLKYTKTTD